ncbi:MAG: N-acetylneuraminate synthase family protein [Methanomicrobiales archaeon]|nr:N-acetylneuraminate synthase family protein [Methanomicrobiales archaeon]
MTAVEIFVIAEIGINHNGDLAIAERLIDAAKEAGCDAVKFQKRTIDVVYTREFLASARESPWGTTQRAQKEGLEFGKAEYDAIDAYCREKGIHWFASAWDNASQQFLRGYDLPFNKVASAMLTYPPLLEMIASEGKPAFVSTGMSSYREIDAAVRIFRDRKCPFTLMHTVSTYPSEDGECNLLALRSLAERYRCPVGYSGHERGILPSLLAGCLGAVAIERHITLDRKMYGSDQAASLEPAGLRELVKGLRAIPGILGDGARKVSEKEAAIAKKLRYFE